VETCIVVFFGSALLAILGTPLVTRLGRARGIMDVPGPRKVHKSPVPRIGGVVIVVATLALVLPVLALDNSIGEAFREIAPSLMTLLAASVLVFAVGLLDDIRGVRAAIKLVCLIAASLAVCLTGSRVQTISMAPWFTLDLGWAAWPVTVLWIVGVTVGMNFIDGLDGLAAGIAAVVCGTTAAFALISGQWAMAVLMLALLGSLTGFLFFNFNPAKVFLGDCGSMFLGFILAAGSVICQAKTSTLIGIALPACALGVPIVDAAFTMVRRGLLDRRSVFAAERGHIHHRLLGLGLRQRHVVIIIYGVTLATAVLGLAAMTMRHTEAIAVFVGVLVLLLVVFQLVGAARVGDTVTAIKRDFARSRETKRERHTFEDAQLRMREAGSFDDWWAAICAMSADMDVSWISLTFTSSADEPVRTSIWRRPGPPPSLRDIITMTIPVARSRPGASLEIEAGFRVNGSLEAAARRAGLLGRLIDECDLSSMPEVLRNLGWPEVEPTPQAKAVASRMETQTSLGGLRPSVLHNESLSE
jgi:UDP-N-acetylmuramyl pentapeptide phosphotransferase/UDP-N-acetylglucosamine-1-phosphate transferase